MLSIFKRLSTLWFGSKSQLMSLPVGFFLVLFGLVLIILLPNISTISAKLGFKSKDTLRAEISHLEESVNTTRNANQALARAVDVAIKIQDINVKAVEETNKKKNKVKDTVSDIKGEMNNAATGLKPPLDTTNSETVEKYNTEFAKTQVSGIWKAYCEFNIDPQCLSNTKNNG